MFRLQDPQSQSPARLLEAMSDASCDAVEGGAMFAFASRGGVELLGNDADFARFLQRGSFDLIVGTDAVTDTVAIRELVRMSNAYPLFNARALVHSRGSLFHPKVCWFRTNAGGVVFVGSGNLTVGGLVGNWEAYGILEMDDSEFDDFRTQWSAWLDSYGDWIHDVDSSAVWEKAARNLVSFHQDRRIGEDPLPQKYSEAHSVLIAEIPAGGTRWNQANFNRDIFFGFFGADPNSRVHLYLWSVDPDGAVGPMELRPTVTVKSHNFRVELAAAAGLQYPEGDERPIGIFLKIAEREFRYQVLMPQTPGYDSLQEVLGTHVGQFDSHHLRRVVLSSNVIKRTWKGCPLFKVPPNAEPSSADSEV